MKFNKTKYLKDGFLIQKKIISKSDVNRFTSEIKKLAKLYKKKSFEIFFKSTKDRALIYKKLQNLNSVRKIVQKVCNKLEKNNVYSKLGVEIPSIENGLIVSLPNENNTLNPLHQDIYNFLSFNFIKIWLPLTKVNNQNGSMLVYKSSNNLGFIKPKYKNKYSTYPEVNQQISSGYEKVIFELDPGDCVIFNPLILHQSVSNKSNVTRFNIGIDIQDFHVNGDKKMINKMIKIKNERSRRRNLFANK